MQGEFPLQRKNEVTFRIYCFIFSQISSGFLLTAIFWVSMINFYKATAYFGGNAGLCPFRKPARGWGAECVISVEQHVQLATDKWVFSPLSAVMLSSKLVFVLLLRRRPAGNGGFAGPATFCSKQLTERSITLRQLLLRFFTRWKFRLKGILRLKLREGCEAN